MTKTSNCVIRSVNKAFFVSCNRQNSYSPTVLGRVGLDHECKAHAETFSPRGQTNMKQESPKGDFKLGCKGAIFSEGRERLYTLRLP